MTKDDLRILFMGTPDFALCSLKELVENKFNIVGLFCKEDKPKGRGLALSMPPTKEYALKNNILVFQPSKLKENEEVKEILKQLNPNLIIVVAYGKILPKYILDYPKYGCINVHGSILPNYRGAAPIQWAVINGDKESGITTMYMDEGMDTGDIITISKAKIEDNDTYETLHDKLAPIGAKTLLQDLETLLKNNGVLKKVKQPADYTLAPMITKENSKIDFNKNAEEIVNLIRGTNPFPTAWCKITDERMFKIYEAEKIDFESNIEAQNGEIVFLSDKKDEFIVKCKDGYINILKLKAPGTRLMSSSEYIRGGKIKVKEKFI